MYSQKDWNNFCKIQDEIRTKDQHKHFQDWVKTNDNELKLHMLLNHIHEALDNSPYELKNKNEFKDEFATFIYKLSHNA